MSDQAMTRQDVLDLLREKKALENQVRVAEWELRMTKSEGCTDAQLDRLLKDVIDADRALEAFLGGK